MTNEEMENKINALEKKVRELDDVENIKKLHRDYLFYISNVEMDKALACFSDDIITEVANYGTQKGIAEVTRFFKERIADNVQSSNDAHFTGQAVINVDGDKAEGHWMFYRLLAHPKDQGWVQGRYDCEYVKVNGAWKFSILKMQRPWPAFFKA